jgi:nitric oxide reductase NorD protein
VAEAEDVILHAAAHATALARPLWRRHRPPSEPPGLALADVSRRLGVLILACFGRCWPLIPSDPEAVPSWLARRLRGLPPWADHTCPQPFSDGVSIFLPRHLAICGDEAAGGELLRLMAFMLAARLERGSLLHCPSPVIVRDLFWAADGVVVEGHLAQEFPSLTGSIAAARRSALACRPSLDALKWRERAVEVAVRRLLEAPPGGLYAAFPDAPSDPAAADLAHWAVRVAAQPPFHGQGVYRGLAPVLHWGRPRPDLLRPSASGGRGVRGRWGQQPAVRSRRLPQRVEARSIDDEEGRQGPFLIPHGDSQQSVEDLAGLRRPSDQGEEPDLEALAEELARLGQVVRVASEATVHDILELEGVRWQRIQSHSVRGAVDEVGLMYPEWDHRLSLYRQGHCLVCETAAALGDAQWSAEMLRQHNALIRDIRRRFEALRPKRLRDTRQLDGDDLDVDAYVDDFAARRAGLTPTDRLYLTDRPRRRDVSVAFLIDASGSTDAWVSGERRVLDIEKQAALVFCEALEALGDRYAIYAFASLGARDVRVQRLKAFAEHYGETVRRRIAGLHGETYTRLGVAIRHLTACLARQPARLRLLFLLSDGKPNDEDAYEGIYGIEDTRQAVAEARLQGVHLFCLTIDRQGSMYLPRMFGPHGYTILWEVTQLPQRLPEIYRRITTARTVGGPHLNAL